MTAQDVEQLRLLAIFHYVLAGLCGLFALFPVIHLVIGLRIISGRMDAPAPGPEGALIGWFFVGAASIFIVAGLALAACLFLAARYLQQRERYTFCLVVAALACMITPFGTVLGVFTIIVLMRESVKQAFVAARP